MQQEDLMQRKNKTETNGHVTYTHLRAHETKENLVGSMLIEKKKNK